MILVGIDEAGYGPTLGPLVVAATAFRVPDPEDGKLPNLWRILRRSTCRKPDGRRCAVDDSKKLYSTAKGVGGLEEGALAFLTVLDGDHPGDLRGLIRRLSAQPDGDGYLDSYPWYRARNAAVPAVSFTNRIRRTAERLTADLAANGVELVGIRALPVEVLDFNRVLEETNNKAAVTFGPATSLLAWVWDMFPDEPIEAMVDRQGGRMRYGPLLYEKVRPRGIRIGEETDTLSSYELFRSGPPLRVSFAVDCDGKCLAVSLASMFCKYVRELHMSIFNGFWAENVASLRPTAGYNVDARRFLVDIDVARQRLAVDDAALVRRR
jgi:hypothetical protein